MGKRAAPKAGEAEAKAPAKRSGGRGRGRAASAGAPSDAFIGEREVTRADASNFTTSLRYTASPGSKAAADVKDQAADALLKYSQMDSAQKKEFIKKWMKNKKDLSWVSSIQVTKTTTGGTLKARHRGDMTIFEILDLNKMPRDLPDAQKMVEQLILESEKEFGYKSTITPHENPLLRKYYYIKRDHDTERLDEATCITRSDVIDGTGARMDDALTAASPTYCVFIGIRLIIVFVPRASAFSR